jgi:hypothetical protein
MPTKSAVIPSENSEVEQRVGVEAGTSLENGTSSSNERRSLTQNRAKTRRNRLAGTALDVNEAHRLLDISRELHCRK